MLCIVVCRFMVERAPTSFVARVVKGSCHLWQILWIFAKAACRSEFLWIFISAPKWANGKTKEHTRWRSWKQFSYVQIDGVSVKKCFDHIRWHIRRHAVMRNRSRRKFCHLYVKWKAKIYWNIGMLVLWIEYSGPLDSFDLQVSLAFHSFRSHACVDVGIRIVSLLVTFFSASIFNEWLQVHINFILWYCSRYLSW